ncbi:imelysin family protein [Tenacibaculum maritimum]|uniref:imelysin family protein n=1 Tax=Tenacibaculum maritimum TaxID=107401 RepID=UPI0012E65424|nr:imelysin family protein [Tenacibaculum maritimum]CAA0223849.1 Iron regulated protein; Imelysin family lipoprotein precursor [Tenacibaculum maritimum]
MIHKNLTLLLIIFLFTACSDDTVTQSFDLKQLRNNFIKNIETPSTNKLLQNIELLNKEITAFSMEANRQNLEKLQSAWKLTAIAFSGNEILNIGAIKASGIHNAFYSWNANEEGINNYINSSNVISGTTINTLPTNFRGLSAIEFLIFDASFTETLASFSNQRRVQYLKMLGKNLLQKAISLNKIWKNYRAVFISNNTTGIDGGINIVINQINASLENIKRFKIGEPAGIERTTSVDINKLQAEKSASSIALIKKNINTIKEIYFGKTEGLADYVSFITKNNDLNIKIGKQFELIENSITKLNSKALKDVLLSNPNDVKELYDTIKSLIILIKADLASALSITITFTDNDGD